MKSFEKRMTLKDPVCAAAAPGHGGDGPVWRQGLHQRHGHGEAGGPAEERRQHAARLRVPQRCQGLSSSVIRVNHDVIQSCRHSFCDILVIMPSLYLAEQRL